MPWYRTGTVAITAGQTTVTGTGTNFSLNARVGDALQGPDGRWYEVANIASATVMSILPAYQGTTVAAGSYGLAPMQGYVKELADSARQVINQWGTALAGLGTASTGTLTTSTSDSTVGRVMRVGDFGIGWYGVTVLSTSIRTLLTSGTYYCINSGGVNLPPGVNSNGYLKVHGQSALYCRQVFTHVTNGRSWSILLINGTWGEWQPDYSASNIVGAVSQSGGLPTGAIIERGSNASGEYTKFADGTLICRRFVSDYAISCAVNATVMSPLIPFPVQFLASPSVSINGFATDGPGNPLSIPLNDSSIGNLSNWRFDLRNTTSTAVTRVAALNLTAIGRWS